MLLKDRPTNSSANDAMLIMLIDNKNTPQPNASTRTRASQPTSQYLITSNHAITLSPKSFPPKTRTETKISNKEKKKGNG
jgi:hypothetical protein